MNYNTTGAGLSKLGATPADQVSREKPSLPTGKEVTHN